MLEKENCKEKKTTDIHELIIQKTFYVAFCLFINKKEKCPYFKQRNKFKKLKS